MPSRDELARIAAETVAIVERGSYVAPDGTKVDIAAAVARQAAATRIHEADAVLPPPSAPSATRTVRVVDVDAVGAILDGGDADGGACCLVFASARRPGGGFLTGANAQEESLVRSSTLHASFREAAPFYERHRASRDLAYSDAAIHAPGALLLRDPAGRLLAEPVACAFVVAAAPNLAAMRGPQPRDVGKVAGILARRAGRVLDVCAHHGHRRLILGAWGCGVFGNAPATVARAFAGALAGRPWFDDVTFAIPGIGTAQHAAFAAAFPPA